MAEIPEARLAEIEAKFHRLRDDVCFTVHSADVIRICEVLALVAAARREAGLREALTLLVNDVADYPAWDRPCHALNVARTALAAKGTP